MDDNDEGPLTTDDDTMVEVYSNLVHAYRDEKLAMDLERLADDPMVYGRRQRRALLLEAARRLTRLPSQRG